MLRLKGRFEVSLGGTKKHSRSWRSLSLSACKNVGMTDVKSVFCIVGKYRLTDLIVSGQDADETSEVEWRPKEDSVEDKRNESASTLSIGDLRESRRSRSGSTSP